MKLKLPELYFTYRSYTLAGALVFLYVLGFFHVFFYHTANLFLLFLLLLTSIEIGILFKNKKGIEAKRHTPLKLSNGDDNVITIYIKNQYPFDVHASLVDELPILFQIRDFKKIFFLPTEKETHIRYTLKPTQRGEYYFGAIRVFVSSRMKLVERRFSFQENNMLPVYPSFIQMKKYELLAIHNRLTIEGIKKIRRLGHTSEFEYIKEYAQGDYVKNINWKASARRNKIMVNKYQDEKAQQVYCAIDMGRTMKMPFNGMTLLDYAINASLVLSNIAYKKDDKPGLITFSDKVQCFVAAERRSTQMHRIVEALYKQQTLFYESSYEQLYQYTHTYLTQRSLFLLFTNFEHISSLKRQLKYLKQLSKKHTLLVVFFENTELQNQLQQPANNILDIYYKAIAEKMNTEKHIITNTLSALGIQSIYTAPQNLSVAVINKYLELKARGLV
ncbi:MAG: DUF58 domain-containing protein [Bacteroidetes bacterium]|nr:DUF58 domain-containing protein [Bacteroidota bacterium]